MKVVIEQEHELHPPFPFFRLIAVHDFRGVMRWGHWSFRHPLAATELNGHFPWPVVGGK